MIEVAADKSTRRARKGAAERGCRRRAAKAMGPGQRLGRRRKSCGLSRESAESCHEKRRNYMPIMMDIMTGILFFGTGRPAPGRREKWT